MIRNSFNLALTLIMGTCLLLAACGKKPESKDSSQNVQTAPGQTALDTFLDKQDVFCEQNLACPSFVTKIVVVNDDKSYGFCTGFLLDKDQVATSTSCLPGLMRLVDSDCSKNVFFFFPKSGNRPAEKVGCSQVLQVSQLDNANPALWRDDLAILQMSKPLLGRKVSYAKKGLIDNRDYFSFMVDQQGDFSAIIKRVSCTAIHQNYVNPLTVNVSSPNVTLAGCLMTNAGTGSPVLDNSGKIRALVSVPISNSIRDYILKSGLLTNGLKEMVHATNLACAPLLNDLGMLDERECSKDLTEEKLNKARAEMLSSAVIFKDLQDRFIQDIDKKSKFLKFAVEFSSEGDIRNTKISLQCIRPFKTWPSEEEYYSGKYAIESFELPVTILKRSMNPVGRVLGIVMEKEPVKITMQFQTKSARNSRYATVTFFRSATDYTVYQDIPLCK